MPANPSQTQGGVKLVLYNPAHLTRLGTMTRALEVSQMGAEPPETPARRRLVKAASTTFHTNSTTNFDSQPSRGV
ncbi:uncharacterized protein N7498_003068 [Penicillium cinerascens]|uniref:Uncharacterized protein n=1 Tax=Penicillium cinerascens TaxID=70096 RepID=A0A9W9NB98_9EURO|nr:uncharacterized protein N7498_003068 [Penicillium cinerascens]KAJ5216661.1 hypothetical protein N7498_003068 [Penicillium cinerascens]